MNYIYMPRIAESYFVQISAVLTTANRKIIANFSEVPFFPDEMIVRQIFFVESGNSGANTVSIKSDLTNGVLGIINTTGALDYTTNLSTENRFILKNKNIHGDHVFQMIDRSSGIPGDLFLDGVVSLLIEFVKYK